jgi:hypothetical protein
MPPERSYPTAESGSCLMQQKWRECVASYELGEPFELRARARVDVDGNGGERVPMGVRSSKGGAEGRVARFPPAGAWHPHLALWGQEVHGPPRGASSHFAQQAAVPEEQRRLFLLTGERARRHAARRWASTDPMGLAGGAHADGAWPGRWR